MKLLFDANLSPKLVGRLEELFPNSTHVFFTGLVRSTPDIAIWEYARAEGYAIVSADSDFLAISERRGPPPKIVYLEGCDYGTSEVESLLRRHAILIAELETSPRATLVLRKNP